eukprot:CAMPEP_0204127440 /NCGR_PEP_ID=MMETSP0361-20130328/11595_1 /ASSEMBLY_ACC=CAM_ASM_000343 /TAXON_ID=268821 /ORGANISM="Scrippsiella Hangoei, Strain SHTV-5" /LENGTH=122 /DNA_ID=CAMNT_0051079489 /DNA_START=172 /DNA_END=537 /DNA_ORIENTATION=+
MAAQWAINPSVSLQFFWLVLQVVAVAPLRALQAAAEVLEGPLDIGELFLIATSPSPRDRNAPRSDASWPMLVCPAIFRSGPSQPTGVCSDLQPVSVVEGQVASSAAAAAALAPEPVAAAPAE